MPVTSRALQRALAALVVLATGALASPPAAAKDLGGKLGVGVEQSIGGVSGLALRYWPGQSFGFLLTVGGNFSTFQFLQQTGTDEDGNAIVREETGLATAVDLSVGVVYNFARSLHANLGIGLRGALGFRTAEAARQAARNDGVTDGDVLANIEGGTHLNIELPLTLEFFLSDSFSVSVATGLLFALVPDEGALLETEGLSELTAPGTWGLTVGAGSVTGTLGIIYYF